MNKIENILKQIDYRIKGTPIPAFKERIQVSVTNWDANHFEPRIMSYDDNVSYGITNRHNTPCVIVAKKIIRVLCGKYH